MVAHWLDALARRMAITRDRRWLLRHTSKAALIVAGGALVAAPSAAPVAARAPSASSCCRYLCDGSHVGRAALGQSSHFVWVPAAEPCPALDGCTWLQRIDVTEA